MAPTIAPAYTLTAERAQKLHDMLQFMLKNRPADADAGDVAIVTTMRDCLCHLLGHEKRNTRFEQMMAHAAGLLELMESDLPLGFKFPPPPSDPRVN